MLSLDVDFNKANRQTRDLAQCADDMQQQRSKLDSIIAEIQKSWQGDTAKSYTSKLEAFSKVLETNIKQCREVATAMSSKIDKIKAAEEEAQRAAESLAK